MKRLVALLVLALMLVVASSARSHFIPRTDAESRWYYVYSSHCGAPAGWNCKDRRNGVAIPARNPDAWIRVGYHSYFVNYWFREYRIVNPLLDRRLCSISGQLQHTTVVSASRQC